MELANFDDLKPNPKNPRKISEQDFEALKRSIQKFGDLSSLIMNQRTGHLVGGHMRKRAFENLSGQKRVVISQRFDSPNKQGTIAIGYVEHDNELYPYRLVDWDEGTEAAAAISANRIEGSWDEDLLAQVNYELSQLENGDELLALTGQSEDEIIKLLEQVGVEPTIEPEPDQKQPKDDDGLKPLRVRFTDEQLAVVYEAIGMMKHDRQLTNELNSDLDANAIYYICRHYAETHASQNIENGQTTDIQPSATESTSDYTSPASNVTPDLTSIPTDTV